MEKLELDLFCYKERQLERNLIALWNNLMGNYRVDRAKFFFCKRKMKGNRYSWNTRNTHSI